MWMKLKMNEGFIKAPLRRGLESIQRGKIFARDRAVSAEPGHVFYGKGKVKVSVAQVMSDSLRPHGL